MTLTTPARIPAWFRLLLGILAVTLAAGPAAADDKQAAEDEQLLKQAGVTTDGPGLLEFFKKRTPTEVDAKRVANLIKQLGDGEFQVRQKASADLVELGPAALKELSRFADDSDPEVKRRVRECIEAINQGSRPGLVASAARLLKVRRPDGACAVLLNYLPAADDEIEEEILGALLVLGVRDGKADAALVEALKDKLPVKRAAAAAVLARAGSTEDRKAVRPLLADADAKVRLRAAMGFLAGRDKDAVPALVALLSEGPAELAQQAEALLGQVAGDKAPKASLGEDDAARKKCRDAWEAWWKDQGDKLDLAKADPNDLWLNPAARGREVALQFLNAFIKGDAAVFKKVTAVPFHMSGDQTFNTREQFDQFWDMFLPVIQQQQQMLKLTFTADRMVTVDEYLKTATPKEKEFLDKLPRSQVRVVYMTAVMDGRAEGGAVFVRVSGGRVAVIGIGQGKGPEKPNK